METYLRVCLLDSDGRIADHGRLPLCPQAARRNRRFAAIQNLTA